MTAALWTVAWAAIFACSCGGGDPPSLAIDRRQTAAPPADGLTEAQRARLEQPPFSELSFVPEDAEAVIRVDLAALAARDAATHQMLDFILRAQQPAAWEFLVRAGISPGKELRAIYLIVGRGDADGAAAFLIAGVGTIDLARTTAALSAGGAKIDHAPGGASIFQWKSSVDNGVGAAIPGTKALPVGNAAIGVAEGLLLVGTPALVERALAVRAGQGRDVRRGGLARELAAVDPLAAVWGAAHSDRQDAYVSGVVPGLRAARFHASLATIGQGSLHIRAEFGEVDEASAFRADLATLFASAAGMARGSELGEALARMRDGAKIEVDGKVVTVKATL